MATGLLVFIHATAWVFIVGVRTYVPKIGVFGVTGVGKSSLCNALFGSDVAVISDVVACMGYGKRDCGRCLRGC